MSNFGGQLRSDRFLLTFFWGTGVDVPESTRGRKRSGLGDGGVTTRLSNCDAKSSTCSGVTLLSISFRRAWGAGDLVGLALIRGVAGGFGFVVRAAGRIAILMSDTSSVFGVDSLTDVLGKHLLA